MPRVIDLPDGGGVRPHILVRAYPTDTGAACDDNGGNQVVFIKISDPEIKREAVRVLKELIRAGKQFVQPDWSFLDERSEGIPEELPAEVKPRGKSKAPVKPLPDEPPAPVEADQ